MIEARGLTVRFAAKDPATIADVDLSLDAGEILGLVGPPEAGKTILLKALAGLIPLSGGEVHCDGARVDGLRDDALTGWQARIGMAFQNDALFDAMTVFDNVAFPLRRRRVPEAQIRQRVQTRLNDVELPDAGEKYPSEISGGMRKRVGIARATVIEPELGLFDDPIAGLDPVTGGRILDLIVGLTERLGMATIVISNDLAVLFPICSRVMMMWNGQRVYLGEANGMLRSERPEVVQFATGGDAGPL